MKKLSVYFFIILIILIRLKLYLNAKVKMILNGKIVLEEIDEDGSGEIEFEEFCQLCAKFLIEEPDEETMKKELKEAFRVYDKEANGFITTDQLREIIAELDARLTSEDLDGIIEEIDEDGSGTMDFDEFCAMMMS